MTWSNRLPAPVEVIDSHTGGEPTRLVIGGGPDLGAGTMVQKLERFRSDFDAFRSAVVEEPRGSDVLVGAMLVPASDPSCQWGVIFFNNVGTLWMCGHGMIGVVASLAYLGKVKPGVVRIDTAVGPVEAQLHEDGQVTITNVPSYRYASQVKVAVPSIGEVVGDIAWGGNWFFLIEKHGLVLSLANLESLTSYAWAVRQTLTQQGVTGADQGEIDHVELFGPSSVGDSKNFVLCPGKAYDRSPCGTGTSAKLACLAAAGKLAEHQEWRQESIIGSVFKGSYQKISDGKIVPKITGQAYVMAHGKLLFQANDPFIQGINNV
jgi:4-hydroxyproline epimerase